MSNIFNKDKSIHEFSWENLGDVKSGREDLGEEMPVLVHRLMQFTMLDTLSKEVGPDQANEYFRRAGFLAGSEFSKHILNLEVDFDTFVADLAQALADFKIGILRMEALDPDTGGLVLTVGQDLDCSGLPVTNETVCYYDEGFIAGILYSYTGKAYDVQEVDCWATGDRVCRFTANPE